jgi:hypothetical protein
MIASKEYSIELDTPGQLETDSYRRFWTKLDASDGPMSLSPVVAGRIVCNTEVVPPIVTVSVAFEDQKEPSAEIEKIVGSVKEAMEYTHVDERSLILAQLAVNQFERTVNFGGAVSSHLRLRH